MKLKLIHEHIKSSNKKLQYHISCNPVNAFLTKFLRFFFLLAYKFIILKYNTSTPSSLNYFSLQDSNESNQEVVEETEEEVVEPTHQEQWKTITMQEYNSLMQLNLQIQKLQNTIDEINQSNKLKDSQLEDLRTTLKREKNKFIDVSELSTVSV